MQQPSDHYGRYSYQGDAYLYLLGRISSEDVKRVELFRNGVSQGDVVLAPVDKTSAVRELVFNRLDARGVYALRFYDQTGATYTESYEFLSRAVKYPWDSDSGDYQLPFVQNSKDPRMTTSFRLESSGSGARSGNGDFLFSSSNRNFVTF